MFDHFKKSLPWKEWLQPLDGSIRKKYSLLCDMHQGDRISFGVVPIGDLTHKTLTLGASHMYHFDGVQVESHPLLDAQGHPVCNLIVTSTKQHIPYLVVSCPIPTIYQSDLCTPEDYNALCRGQYPRYLYVREHTARMRDWLFMRYECKIHDVQGVCVRPANDVVSFRYAMYHAPEEQKALEIERSPSGIFTIYATLFLPASSIVAIETKTKYLTRSSVNTEQPADNTSEEHSFLSTFPKSPPPVTECEIIPYPRATIALSKSDSSLRAEDAEPLRCSLRMASKLIDEALRSDLPVSYVIRKVLGLGLAEHDQMTFDIHLSEQDYQKLAEQFNLPVTHKKEIMQRVIEELAHFTGDTVDEPS
ncbi:MAG: hypothetical protein EAZ74_01625 [Alphaproteobacteria bacterium]|nr:MAG: hypothetical protein EAZ74_01625 [Alphaproteobacteria bacterium]